MSKLYGLVVRWLFVSRTGIEMKFVGVIGSTLTVYWLSSWFIHQDLKTYLTLCILCWTSHLSWFLGPKYIPPSFLPRVTNHDVCLKTSTSDVFNRLLYNAEKLRRKSLIFLNYMRRSWYAQRVDVIFFFITRCRFGINGGKSAVVVWENLPYGIPESHQTFPRGAAPRESLMTLGNSIGQIFQTTTEDFPLFFRLLD